MQDLRSEIRAILQEELARLVGSSQAVTEYVSIDSDADLNQFAKDLLTRALPDQLVERLNSGQLKFALAEDKSSTENSPIVQKARPLLSQAVPKPSPTIDKKLITERDINALDVDVRVLTLHKQCRLTPLASDEVNRRGIRIIRIKQ